jgi:N-acetylmuramoyl-L-alanine amidase
LLSALLWFLFKGMVVCPSLRLLVWLAMVLSAPLTGAGQLSPLAPKPNWTALESYQRTITRQEFARLIDQVYTPDGAFWNYADIDDKRVAVFSDTGKKHPLFTLHFAAGDSACAPPPYPYKTEATSHDPSQPLKGIRIALDPGHIGGDWAVLEARYFKLDGDPPVEEAKLNMITCQRLAERLQADGAEIVWAKRGYEPVTSLRPDTLHREAIAALESYGGTRATEDTPTYLFGIPMHRFPRHRNELTATESRIDNEAALLFYRVAEIRARAEVVNALHPDLTICVHYNADDWGNPDHPVLTANSRLIIFTNGAYERKAEMPYDDCKYDLLRKLLDRTAVQEERGCALVGQAMLDTLKYPPEVYNHIPSDKDSPFVHHVTDVPSVYARDLLANRIYHGPVIYCEGPYMNARDAYYRIIAGDYLGLRAIQGQSVPSIYRDYAAAVEKGVLKYFGRQPRS